MSSVDVSRATTATLDAGGQEARMPGALVYEYRPQITQVVEYGASADAVLSGQAPPAEGARFDFYLEGPVSGPKLQGTFRGVDYIYFRADGRAEEGSPVFQLREHVSLMSNHPELSWVNSIEVWARGVVDVSTRQVHVQAYRV